MGKRHKDKPLTAKQIRQIDVDTNTDDKTVAEMLAEDNDINYKFPYSDDFVENFNLRKPVEAGAIKK